jgi:hypothetical protein
VRKAGTGILRRNEVQTSIHNAEIVREYPDSPERTDAAREQVHRAMYRAALGQITENERTQILAILTPCCPDFFSYPLTPIARLPEDDSG